jgi:quercetin dioxygenase-like cupin family protein
MHVSTLNEGLTNHTAHTHGAEEFVVMIKGEVVMLIGEENYSCSIGDVIFLSSMIPHSLNNTGMGETMYFAFQFWQ